MNEYEELKCIKKQLLWSHTVWLIQYVVYITLNISNNLKIELEIIRINRIFSFFRILSSSINKKFQNFLGFFAIVICINEIIF